ncbi:hypothetical protein MNV49_000648 [Pseudohyphozyma bogoriensis]|nr:hypothetical protein MNV49_000648 [Pseudohyphozyma bogoriensis]
MTSLAATAGSADPSSSSSYGAGLYNETKWTRQFLKRHRKLPPSLVVHLYTTYFRFEQQHGNFTYDSPMKCFLEAIREQKLPTDLLDVLDEAGVRYYEGCLIVEVHDHRSAPPPAPVRPAISLFQSSHTREPPAASKAELFRIVLAPNPATLWTQLGLQERKEQENQGRVWTEQEAVEMEAVILARTSAPLCLDPSIQTTRIANMMQLATASRPHKRKRFCETADGEEDDAGEEAVRREREERERMMKIGDEGVGRGRGHAFARLAFIEAHRQAQNKSQAEQAAQAAAGGAPPAAGSQIKSLRLGLSTASADGANSAASTPGASPTATKPSKKKASVAHDSDGNPAPKKSKKASAQLDPNDPTLPQDPEEREKVLAERKRQLNAKKRQESKAKAKEKKKAEAAAAQSADLQVGSAAGTPGASTPTAKFSWSGGS